MPSLGIRLNKENKKKKEKLDYSEFGTSGYSFNRGQSQTEYQQDLKGGKAYSVYDRMYRSAGLTKAIVNSMHLPLLAAEWFFEVPKDADKSSEEIKDKVSKNIFETLNIPWNTQLKQFLMFQVYGCKPFEIVPLNPLDHPAQPDEFEQRIRKIAPRHPATIYKWNLDENGGLKGITQRAYFNSGDNVVMKTQFIDIERMVIFINELDGDDYTGVSIFRPCYRHYHHIDKFYNISNIGIERNAVGIPIIEFEGETWARLSENEKTNYLAVADEILKNYRVHKYAGFKLLPGMKLTMLEGKFNADAIMGLINHHDSKMAQSVLATFLTTGEGKVGSFALSKNQTEFFLMALNSTGVDICAPFNRYVVKKLVDWNVDNVLAAYPKLNFTLPEFDVKALLEAFNLAINGKLLTPTRTLEQYTRKLLGIKELEDNEEAVSEKVIDQVDKQVKESLKEKEGKSCYHFSEELPWERDLTDAEKRVDFADYKKTLASSEEELQKKLQDITGSQLEAVQKQAQEGKEIEIPLMDEVKALYEEHILKGGKYGQSQIEKEFQSTVKDTKELEEYAVEKAQALADKHKADLMILITEML